MCGNIKTDTDQLLYHRFEVRLDFVLSSDIEVQ